MAAVHKTILYPPTFTALMQYPYMLTISVERLKLKLLIFSLFLFAFTQINCNNNPEIKNSKDSIAQKAALQSSVKDSNNAMPGDTKKLQRPQQDTLARDSARKYIYLTFDDGPQPGTMNCFHICKDLGVKGTFFMVGMHTFTPGLKSQVDSIRSAYPEILLTNHSYSHAFRDKYKTFYSRPREVLEDFQHAQQSLEIPFKIARLPGNSAWVNADRIRSSNLVKPTCQLLDSAGYDVIGWDLEWNFKSEGNKTKPVQSAETMIKMVHHAFENKHGFVPNHIVILTHDRMFHQPAYADSLRKFITELQKNPDYVFETIDQYPKLKVNK